MTTKQKQKQAKEQAVSALVATLFLSMTVTTTTAAHMYKLALIPAGLAVITALCALRYAWIAAGLDRP